MKLGFVSAILNFYTFEEIIDFASETEKSGLQSSS